MHRFMKRLTMHTYRGISGSPTYQQNIGSQKECLNGFHSSIKDSSFDEIYDNLELKFFCAYYSIIKFKQVSDDRLQKDR